MEKNKNGLEIANSITPFIGCQVTNRDEVVDSVRLTICNNIQAREDLIIKLLDFIDGEKVFLGGCTYSKGIDENSFINQVKRIYKIK